MTDISPKRAFAALVVTSVLLMSAFVLLYAQPVGGQLSSPPIACYASLLAQEGDPVAEAGENITAYSNEHVTLNGSGSTGFEGLENLNFTWRVKYQSVTRILYGVTPTTVFNRTGVAEVNLTVKDSLNRTGWDTSFIFVIERPPTWLETHGLEVLGYGIIVAVLGTSGYVFGRRYLAGEALVSPSEKEKAHLALSRWRKIFRQLVRNPMGLVGVVILSFFVGMAIVGPMISGDVKTVQDGNDFLPPSPDHWLGTDNFGIDIFKELLYGARTSMIVGVFSAVIASFLGAAVGLYSGYAGAWKDEIVMRLNDVVLSIPWLVLMIIVAALLGEIDLMGIIIIIGLTGWSYTARMVRAQVLSVKERQYIERAKAIGASDLSIIRRHIFPNTFPLVFANTILTVAISILSEATLSFLGLRPEGEVTWGTMLSFASESSAFQIGLHWWILAPGLCIVVVVLGFTLLGYALDEILNPKLRHR
jgi:peptide/nickel transport system permease protein